MKGFKEAARKLRANASDASLFVGLDGFVDEIIHIVEKRTGYGADDYQRLGKIDDFGDKIKQAAGYSCNFEMVPVLVKLGGQGPIFANALLGLGTKITYCGNIGYPDIHPVFKPMTDHPNCTVISKWPPANTDALEFLDGKIIMGKHRVLYNITWESFKEAVGGVKAMAEHFGKSRLIGLLNWTMLPFMSDIWEGVINEVVPLIKFDGNLPRPIFFFDIADPAKRTAEDLGRALNLMVELNKTFRVVLGLNEKESRQVAGVLGIKDPESLGYQEIAEGIFNKMNIHCLAIHPTTCAFAVTRDGYSYTDGPFCENPVLTTGAGDNFNAGFCMGLLSGLDSLESLKTGVSMSGFYVRNGRSGTISELTDYMETIDI
ncbi:MAG: PfkB family carbohydrate kinase [Defluviitaleaceae bacterium]|nr:PfkB family carbohydrate kinase [Defluviitaleaceae bacterium]MCL2835548.1 PfkB family carbohydrate kinase [Defluviitaleaceae bacterium]